VALVVARRLSGAAHYTEVDAYDGARDAVLLTNGGELDPALANAGSVRPCPNRFFAGAVTGDSRQAAACGPAAVAVHDDPHVQGSTLHHKVAAQKKLP
jgi:hypothetical protein